MFPETLEVSRWTAGEWGGLIALGAAFGLMLAGLIGAWIKRNDTNG